MRAGASTASATFKTECRLGQAIDGRAVQLVCAGALHRGNKRIGHRGYNEHFLLANAQQVIVKSRALNNASCGAIQIGRLIHHHRRISRPAAITRLPFWPRPAPPPRLP